MRRFLLLLFVAAGVATAQSNPVFQSMLKEAKSRVKQVTAADLEKLFASSEKFTLIDVREDNEWTAGHAKAAQHIGRGVLDRDIESKVPQKDTRIVLYCASGGRSSLAADLLQKMGYTNVSSLEGGFSSYKAAGLPVEK